MLRQRIITAVILVLVVLSAILWLPQAGFGLFVAVVIGLGAWEWGGLLRLLWWQRLLYLLLFGLLLLGLHLAGAALVLSLMVISVLWWLLAFGLILRYPGAGQYWQPRAITLLIGVLVLVPGLAALNLLRAQPAYLSYILVFIALVAAADIGAYFSGRALGRRKLAPLVSPNKTWEGVIGGMLATVVVGLLALWQADTSHGFTTVQWLIALGACLLLAGFSVVGDLFESMLKRHCQVKDSGTLLPGHGGVLDRLDSLTAALPVYILGLSALGLL